MPEIALARLHSLPVTEADRDAARRVLFGEIDGLGDINKRRWRRFVSGLLRLEPGEIAVITTRLPRSGVFHRRHMLLEQRLFLAQERMPEWETFRIWLKIGAGFVTWVAGPRGGVVPVPKSISYAECEDTEMREFHEAAVAFLRTQHAAKYLWPRQPAQQREGAIERLLSELDE